MSSSSSSPPAPLGIPGDTSSDAASHVPSILVSPASPTARVLPLQHSAHAHAARAERGGDADAEAVSAGSLARAGGPDPGPLRAGASGAGAHGDAGWGETAGRVLRDGDGTERAAPPHGGGVAWERSAAPPSATQARAQAPAAGAAAPRTAPSGPAAAARPAASPSPSPSPTPPQPPSSDPPPRSFLSSLSSSVPAFVGSSLSFFLPAPSRFPGAPTLQSYASSEDDEDEGGEEQAEEEGEGEGEEDGEEEGRGGKGRWGGEEADLRRSMDLRIEEGAFGVARSPSLSLSHPLSRLSPLPAPRHGVAELLPSTHALLWALGPRPAATSALGTDGPWRLRRGRAVS